ncbi:hypothetical protein [Bradyrhizobium sp. SEMIA]|uniref:hypothetical protein n=1 Tax=Bradyrhizobium sp. SEMIA TaxID=2597515 RepID=UPI0018A40EF9|nr:hypothetical protein [Bradyrhizobium sp. SEMIA]QOG21662.1 hypothetical protein FOM02_34570 [Bradyrhizobium sp. SEMIA]
MTEHGFSYYWDAAKFNVKKHLRGYTINPTPTFDPEGLARFQSAVLGSQAYLEYGCGGSTIEAARNVKKLVSVETDGVFAAAVRAALPPTDAQVSILTPDIGFTRDWGFPVFDTATPGRIEKWKRLPQAPWRSSPEFTPDLVLVDGRMRVACTLEALLRVTPDTTILIDDYVGRNYETVQQFADLIGMHGRMAEFRKKICV